MLYLRFSLFCNGFFYIFIIFFEFEIVAQQLSVVSESEDFGKFHSWEKQLKTFTFIIVHVLFLLRSYIKKCLILILFLPDDGFISL